MNVEQQAVHTIRFLAVDAVEKANSGHPGLPMGAADYAFVLWTKFLRFNPKDPKWIDRDRFILSAGHGSMLLYALLHLNEYDLSLEDIKQFRQLGSKTPGHPEYGAAPGIETTTGPLGQGFGTGVGMALAGKMLAARFNTPDFSPITYRIFGIVSDGDLMEGVTAEAASLAGHLGLGNLIYIYDDNRITIDGSTDLSFSENVAQRFEAYGWHVQSIDGHDRTEIEAALSATVAVSTQPSLVIARSHIAFGSPNKQDSEASHGAPLGAEEAKATKKKLGWPTDVEFHIPGSVKEFFHQIVHKNEIEYQNWQVAFSLWKQNFSEKAVLWNQHFDNPTPNHFAEELLKAAGTDAGATRTHSGNVLQKAAELVPALCGGSADLAASLKTLVKNSPDITKSDFTGQNIHFGVREHGMAAIANGLALSGGFIPYVSTFLIFSDYMRPSIRLAALMGIQVIYVFSHDSIFLGEDGPTHQSVEQIASLRLIPCMNVFRPADASETAFAWAHAIEHNEGPTALILTRQTIPEFERDHPISYDEFKKGGYTLQEATRGNPEFVIIATGSEVPLACETRMSLEAKGFPTRVVSMPADSLFRRQTEEYQRAVLGNQKTRKIVMEAGSPNAWYEFAGREALTIGVTRFGESAPIRDLVPHFGFTVDAVLKRMEEKGWI